MKGNNCSVLAGIIVLSSCLFTAHAQTLAEPILGLRTNASGLELTIAPDPASGVVYLYGGTNLNSLLAAPDLLLLTNMPVAEELRFPVTVTNQSGFFRAVRVGGKLEDFAAPDFPDGEEQPIVLWTLGFPAILVSGATYTADFLLVQTTNQLAAFNGPAQLSVVRLEDRTPHPDAVITPETIFFSQGSCRTNVQVTASTSLAGYVVAVTLTVSVPPSPPPTEGDEPVRAAGDSVLQLVPIINLPDAPPSETQAFDSALAGVEALVDTPNWSLPLPAALPEVSGTFGEWRGHVREGIPHANTHAGLDLVANAGTPVKAARGGIVSAKGDASGKYVTIDHLDGWYSRYLHLSASGLPAKGSYLARGDPVGVVGTTAQTKLPEHLHFELRRASKTGETVGVPGNGRDPLPQGNMFAVRSPARLAVITDVGVTSVRPATQNYSRPTQPVAGSAQTVYVVLQILQAEPKVGKPGEFRRLAPRGIRFQSQGNIQPLKLSTPDETAIGALKPDITPPTDAGFARYAHGTYPPLPPLDPGKWFKYWFRWNVSGYSTETSGPRTFTVQTTNYAGMDRSNTYKWGPQILSIESVGVPANNEQRYRLSVRAWLGEDSATASDDLAAGSWVTGADWLRYELSPGGNWVGNSQTTYEETGQSTGISKIRTQDFLFSTLSGGAPNPFVIVRSRTVPSIAHSFPILNMAFIPAGSFMMGDSFSSSEGSYELPLHTVNVSAFSMDKYEVTKLLWEQVYTWAIMNGYVFEYGAQGKAANHPAHSMTWYDAVKWCNARSEREGRIPAYYTGAGLTVRYRIGQVAPNVNWTKGYRLPTEAEWEKAARGGSPGHRFPWASPETINHSRANYYSTWSGGVPSHPYDVNGVAGYHPTFNDGVYPYTSPVGYFAANGYGLHDMAGNVWEWCWDEYGSYSSATQTDPRGPSSGSYRVWRGGSWGWGGGPPYYCRAAARYLENPTFRDDRMGFRCVLPPGQ